MKKQIIFNISGGVGKNIAATPVVSSLKKKYPDRSIIITTPWLQVWEQNPDIEKAVSLEHTPFFYKDYIRGTDSLIFRLEPYSTNDFLHRNNSLIQTWCDLCDVEYDLSQPKLFFTDEEKRVVHARLFPDPADRRPLFFIQPSGGAVNQPYPVSWARDLPLSIAQEVVDYMVAKGYRAIHIRRENQIPLANTEWIPFTLREAMCAIQFSNKRLFVDSFAAHAAAAFGLPSVVVWITNSPHVFGYRMHTNLEVRAEKEFRHRIDSYLEEYNISGLWHEHPYKDDKIFDPNELIEALEQLPSPPEGLQSL